MPRAAVKEEPVTSSEGEEEDNEEDEWSGGGGGGDFSKLEEMMDEEDGGLGKKKKKKWKRSEEACERLKGKREVMRRLAAGENAEGVGEEEKRELLESLAKTKEGQKRWNDERAERNGGRKRGDYRQRNPNLTKEEKYKLRMEKERWRLLEKKLKMTEEDKEEERKKAYFRMKAWWDNLSKEEQEEKKRQQRLRMKIKREQTSEEEKRKAVEKSKEWRKNLSEEKKKRYLESIAKSVKKMNERKKREDPEGWRRRNAEKSKTQWVRMDEERKRRRLNTMKIYAQKKKLRKELEGAGVESEEVGRRLAELDSRLKVEYGIGETRSKGRPKKGVGQEEGAVHEKVPEKSSDYFWSAEDSRNYGAVHSESKAVEENYGAVHSECTAVEENSEEDYHEGGDDYFDDFIDERPPPKLELAEMEPVPPKQQEITKLEVGNFLWTDPLPPPPPSLRIGLRSSPRGRVEVEVEPEVTVLKNVEPQVPVTSVLPVAVVENTFKCNFCPTDYPSSFASENGLKKHLGEKHVRLCWKCPICREVVLSPKQLSEHFGTVHKNSGENNKKEETVTMPESSLKFGGKLEESGGDNGGSEKTGRNKVKEFMCMKCAWKGGKSTRSGGGVKVFRDWRELHEHVKNKHGKYYWPCEKCHLLKYSNEKLFMHEKICK